MSSLGTFVARRLYRLCFLSLLLLAAAGAEPALAQFGGGGGGFGGGGGGDAGGGGGLGGGTQGTQGLSGVAVDAEGVLQTMTVNDPRGKLTRQRIEEAMGQLDGNLAEPSKLRKVSLTRLEQAVQQKIAAGSGPDDAMKHLAGLTRIEYVFCYPESGDIVVAGPAEPWGQSLSGRMLGIKSGRPVIELQDLVVAMRAFAPGQAEKPPIIYCSIDPTAEGLARMQQFLKQFGRQANPNQTQFIVEQLQAQLGPQVITVGGIPASTHFAQVLVEADYRMKLIGIGLEKPPVRLTSYVDRVSPAAVSRNALQRWYFVPDYQCVRVSDDELSMQMVGEGVKLVGEDEVVAQDGGRRTAGKANRASQAFVNGFTKAYPRLAQRVPVYAQLRNCIDLSVAAAYMQQHDFYGQVGWNMELFGNEELFPVETYNAPKQVASAVNSMWKGASLITPIGGGVSIRPSQALQTVNLLRDEAGQIETTRDGVDLSGLDEGQWWWD
ncbi:MAG: DUF1598 domain-containing protein [Pirellulales bacterium]